MVNAHLPVQKSRGAILRASRPQRLVTNRRTPVSSNIRFINPETLSKPPGYTHVVEATAPGRIVYVAGQLGARS